jgi:hypothetical protein
LYVYLAPYFAKKVCWVQKTVLHILISEHPGI